jgi:hypothetical protein
VRFRASPALAERRPCRLLGPAARRCCVALPNGRSGGGVSPWPRPSRAPTVSDAADQLKRALVEAGFYEAAAMVAADIEAQAAEEEDEVELRSRPGAIFDYDEEEREE